jgi:threonine synthase
MSKIAFYSTNREAEEADFIQALFQGQAPDRGLYMPRTIPSFQPGEVESMSDKPYHEIAASVLDKFLGGVVSREELRRMCRDAYPFDVPIEKVHGATHVMRLDRGPTASFKDFAARMMARLMAGLRPDAEKKLVVLTATSGDTGSAIAHAFYGVPGIEVVVLFPPAEISPRQRKQMTTLGGNITAIGVEGKFDDCQTLVKRAFADPDLRSIDLTSANSINIGRLLPQTVYYIYAYSRLAPKDIVFSVPSGNFGNMMGCLLAKRMGLPVRRLVIATNANDEVPRYLETGVYRKISPSRNCISNAMNVGHPSNFARVIDLYGGRMDETGILHVSPDLDAMRKDMWPVSVSDEETRQTIQRAWAEHRLLLEPHGAVGWAGLEHFQKETGDRGVSVCAETAHPAKFPEEIERLLGFAPEVPDSLSGVEKKNEEYSVLPVDDDAFRRFLAERFAP